MRLSNGCFENRSAESVPEPLGRVCPCVPLYLRSPLGQGDGDRPRCGVLNVGLTGTDPAAECYGA